MADIVPHLANLAEKINAEHALVRGAFRSGLLHALECGRLLLKAKEKVAHGEWLAWLASNCPDLSERLAQRYMRCARDLPHIDTEDPTRVSDLSMRRALELLSYTTHQACRFGIEVAAAKEEEAPPVDACLDQLQKMQRDDKQRRDKEERRWIRQFKKRQFFAQRDAADAQARAEQFGPPPPPPNKTDNQWLLHGLEEQELDGVLDELTRMGQYLDDLVGRTKTCYEYAVSWAAKRAAIEVWRLRERLTYDRDQLLHAVYGLRDLLKDGPVRVRDIRRWASSAGISEGLLALASKVIGADSGKNERGHVTWSLPE